MKVQAIIKARLRELAKIFSGLRRILVEQFDSDLAHRGFDEHRVLLACGRCGLIGVGISVCLRRCGVGVWLSAIAVRGRRRVLVCFVV